MPVDLKPRHALGALATLNVLNYVDRYVAAAVLPLLLVDLNLSDAQGGSVQTAIIVAFTLVAPLAGWLGPTVPRFRLAACGALVWSLATFASGLAPTFALLLIARAFAGVGEATYAVLTPTLISDYYPPDRRARALAVFYAAVPVGAAIGYQLGGWSGTQFGYRTAFFIVGVPGVFLGLLFFLFRDPPRGRFDNARRPANLPNVRETLRGLLERRSFLFNTACQTIYTFALGGLAFWMPTFYTRERGLPLSKATLIFGSIVVAGGLLGTMTGGQISDRLSRRFRGAHFWFSGTAMLTATPFSLLAVLSPTPSIYWPSLFITLFLLFLTAGPLNAAMVNALPPHLRERGYGVITFSQHAFGDALSPTLIGLASDRFGLQVPIVATTLLLGVSGICLLAGRRALIRDLTHAGPIAVVG